MPQVAVRSEHTLISSMRVSPDRTVYGCVLAEVLSSGWRWPELRLGIPMRARVVACLLQLATVDLTLRRYDTDGRRVDEHRAARKPALSVQRKRRDCPA